MSELWFTLSASNAIKCSLMMVKCSAIIVKWGYDHKLMSILLALAWSKSSLAHFTLIEKLHRLQCQHAGLVFWLESRLIFNPGLDYATIRGLPPLSERFGEGRRLHPPPPPQKKRKKKKKKKKKIPPPPPPPPCRRCRCRRQRQQGAFEKKKPSPKKN